jgi:beta-glucosidase
VFNGDTAKIACDHYHRVEEDIALLKTLGVDSYRFSVSWSRIFPSEGVVNVQGLEFYKGIIGALQQASIKPMLTLNHWDVPMWMYEKGSWLSRDSIKWFSDYAQTLFDAFGSSVNFWVTHNEPFVITMLGYCFGLHAPGHKNLKEALIASHHLNLAHGEAVRRFRSCDMGDAKIGITLNISPAAPYRQDDEHIALASIADDFVNHWFLEPLFKSRYPAAMVQRYEEMVGPLSFIHEGDMTAIAEPMDFLGINFYKRNIVKAKAETLFGYVGVDDEQPSTREGWAKYPDVLLSVLRMVRDRYTSLPLYITENGLGLESSHASTADASRFGTYITVKDEVDEVSSDGNIHDASRIAYIENCLKQCHAFINEGGNLKGYYLWSLLDNFEWALGYSKRFGIVHVDFSTQKRTIKDSGYFYQKVIAQRVCQI